MADFLVTGHSGPLGAHECDSIQQIADALAGSGLACVRVADLEMAALRNALEAHGGNRTRAARSLGISVRTLQRKLKATNPAWAAPVER